MTMVFGETRNGIFGPPTELWIACIEQCKVNQPELLTKYLDRHGLSDLPEPKWVDLENATVWHRTHKGGFDSCKHRMLDDSGQSLSTLLERDFFLAPPQEWLDAAKNDLAPVVPPMLDEVVDAEPEVSGNPEERADASEETLAEPPSSVYKCTMVHRNGNSCKKVYKHRKRLVSHQKKVHWKG